MHYKELAKLLKEKNPKYSGLSDLGIVQRAIEKNPNIAKKIEGFPQNHVGKFLASTITAIPFGRQLTQSAGQMLRGGQLALGQKPVSRETIDTLPEEMLEKVDEYREEHPIKSAASQILGAGVTSALIPNLATLSSLASGLKTIPVVKMAKKGVDLAKNSKILQKIGRSKAAGNISKVAGNVSRDIGEVARDASSIPQVAEGASKLKGLVIKQKPLFKKTGNLLKKGASATKKMIPISTAIALNDALEDKTRDPYSNLLTNTAFKAGTYALSNAAASGLMQKLLTGKTRKFIKELGARNVKKSIAQNEPLINVLDDKGANYLKSLKINRNLEAENILAKHAKNVEGRQYKDINDAIERSLGNTSTKEAIANMQAKNEAIYKPLYEKLVESGTALEIKPGTKLFNVMTGQNGEAEVFSKYFNKVPTKYKNAFSNNMPQNQNTITLKVLDKMQKDMGDEIHKMKVDYRGILPDKARLLIEDRNKLISAIDEQVPEYAKTREVFHNMRKLQDKVLEGRDFGKSGEGELKKTIKGMTGSQKDAYQVGVREKLLEDLDKVSKNEGGNIYAKLLNDKTLRDLEAINIPKFNEIKAQSIAQRQALDNLNRISGFSQPQYIKPINPAGAVVMPNRYKLAMLDRLFSGLTRKDYKKMAQAVTSPDVLRRIVDTNESLYGKIPTKLVKNVGKYAFLLPRMFMGNGE